MKAGETKTFNLTFPENYPAKNLAGKEVQFEVTLKEVDEEILPALDDKFAKTSALTMVSTNSRLTLRKPPTRSDSSS